MSDMTDKRLLDYFLPVLLTAAIGITGWIGLSVSDLASSVRVLVYRADTHEMRITQLERGVYGWRN